MNIDYSRIFPENIKQLISEGKLTEIKELASKESNKLYSKYRSNRAIANEIKAQKAREYAYTSSVNNNRSDLEKALIEANYFIDDDKFIKYLNELPEKYHRYAFYTYLRMLNHIKNKQNNHLTLNNADLTMKKNAEAYTELLVRHFNRCIGTTSPEAIINKLSEIASFKPELLLTKAKKVLLPFEDKFKAEISNIDGIESVYYDDTQNEGKKIIFRYIIDGDTIIYNADSYTRLAYLIIDMKKEFAKKNIEFEVGIIANNANNTLLKEVQEEYNFNLFYARPESKNKRK